MKEEVFKKLFKVGDKVKLSTWAKEVEPVEITAIGESNFLAKDSGGETWWEFEAVEGVWQQYRELKNLSKVYKVCYNSEYKVERVEFYNWMDKDNVEQTNFWVKLLTEDEVIDMGLKI